MTKVIINGAKGRMGQALLACAVPMTQIQIVGAVDAGDDLSALIDLADVVIDFSFHSVTPEVADLCVLHRKALVIGTTGHSADEKNRLLDSAKKTPVVWSSNYSIGVNTLFWLVRKATEILGPAFDLEVVEMHHRLKKDAPSGTAMTIAEILAEVRGQQINEVIRHGREGIVRERTNAEIGMHSIRGGDVVGDHTVIYSTLGERVELTHKASNRDTFANGALRAAEWVSQKPAGLYNMQHVLGLQ